MLPKTNMTAIHAKLNMLAVCYLFLYNPHKVSGKTLVYDLGELLFRQSKQTVVGQRGQSCIYPT